MNTNKIIIYFTVITVFLLIFIPTTYKIVKNHHINLINVVESKIISAAKKCYYEEKCQDKKVFLKELYEFEYLDKISNPITKEYYNEYSYVLFENNSFKFVPEE